MGGAHLTLKAVRERLEGKMVVATQTDVQLVGEDTVSCKGGQSSFSSQPVNSEDMELGYGPFGPPQPPVTL